MATSPSPHVVIDENDVAWIDDTNVKVIEVALDRIARGWIPEEIHFQHPHLSLAQVYAALGFYYDYQDEMDEQIRRRNEVVEQLEGEIGDTAVMKKLRAAGVLP